MVQGEPWGLHGFLLYDHTLMIYFIPNVNQDHLIMSQNVSYNVNSLETKLCLILLTFWSISQLSILPIYDVTL